jgi:membrane protease YdiL (CAAX protease family)
MFLEQSLSYKNPFWLYILGSFVIILFTIFGQIPLTMVVIDSGVTDASDPMESIRALDKNLQLALLLLPFAVGFLGLWLVVSKLHNRTLRSIATSRSSMDWKRFFFAFAVWGAATSVFIALDYMIQPENFIWNFKAGPFSLLFLIGIVLIPIQTSLEEYIFRGYLLQGFGGLFRNSWLPLLFTSVIFGSLHLFNPEVEKLGYWILVYYIGTGLFLGILTLMDQGIELALGFHAANNLITALLVTSDWTAFQTESVLIDTSTPSLGAELLVTLLFLYPIFLWITAKKYNWTDWKTKLTNRF